MAKTKKTTTNSESTEGRKATGRKHVKTSTAHAEAGVIMDRRGKQRRKEADRRNESLPVPTERRTLERRVKVNRGWGGIGRKFTGSVNIWRGRGIRFVGFLTIIREFADFFALATS